MALLRLFIAVDPGSAVSEQIARAIAEIRPFSPGAKWIANQEGGYHITLVFLGSVDEARLPELVSAVSEVARRHAPLTLQITKGGGFGRSSRPRVLWAGVTGDVEALTAIQKDVEAAAISFGVAPEDRAFTPHITLARAKTPGGDVGLSAAASALRAIDFGEARVSELLVYRSDLTPAGPRYTAVARAPLGPETPGRA
jgi:RNA 2',3'-cyclic 3'-phosphodiesterase